MIERRPAKRFANALPLFFLNSGKEYSGVSLDFSVSGLFILTRELFSPGTSLKMRLEVSEKETIHLRGVVVRTIKTDDINVKNGMGIKLDEVPYKYHQLLESLKE
ncbi:MAG TPA: PilZ domain-containing protein [Nitrospirae bacterium]|nr:PilZ domain protein [bacterium BMS3Abin09]GBE40267.1 PilZ domain protein [bacterium BMS3Bbin09]HDN95201.1 PilZ domain-containing protein [Nitrospirota bacterium]HDO25803.1 PilZ domain-containing protein [Nitrospirota bacterium]HDO66972.1 PilZ domain-containing protein [Nitrospirota bacterium]